MLLINVGLVFCLILKIGSGLNDSIVSVIDSDEDWNPVKVDENLSNEKELYSGDDGFRSLDKEMRQILVQGRQSKENNECIVNLGRADVLFVVELGSDFPDSALTDVKDFIKSTLKIMELGMDRVRVGVLGVGSSDDGVTELLSIDQGTSHRNVQTGLEALIPGQSSVDFKKALTKVDNIVHSHNETMVIVSVLTAPNKLVDEFLHNLAVVNNRLTYYLVTQTATVSGAFSEDPLPLDEMNFINPSLQMAPETGYFPLSRSSGVASELLEQFGCNFCLPSPCGFGTRCFLNEGSYHCECLPGYVSGVCEPCKSNPCSPSNCLVSGSSYICDPCDPLPCENGGRCFYRGNGSYCTCEDDFVGEYCELRCPACQNGGKCRYLSGEAVCECANGFIGLNCDRDCTSVITCLNGGTCTFDEDRNPICSCVKPFHGRRCEYLCYEDTCKNGGSCGVANSGHTCYCTPRYEGENCELDKCNSYFKCRNGGSCGVNEDTNQIECSCVAPFTGVDCSIGPCHDYLCMNGGKCRLTENNRPVCECAVPFIGEKCTKDPCTENPCLNGGICLIVNNTFECICEYGFYGRTCQINPCEPNPCFNGGVCTIVNEIDVPITPEYFSCACAPSFTGRQCLGVASSTLASTISSTNENAPLIDVCLPNPCLLPCECLPSCKHANGYVCASSDGRLGKNCSIPAPTLNCGSETIFISIENRLLVELQGTGSDTGYFELGSMDKNDSTNCKSTKVFHDLGNFFIHNLVVPAPFTSCGTETFLNKNGQIVVTNQIWFNVNNSSVYDMPTPILSWHCNYTTEYQAISSITPVVDNNMVHLIGRNKLVRPVHFSLCKMVDQCTDACPSHLVVQPGGVYTIGQRINVIIKLAEMIPETNKMLNVVDFYLSCGQNASSDPVVALMENGCPTGRLPSNLAVHNFTICMTFQLPQLKNCNVVYLHAKLTTCERKEMCDNSPTMRCAVNRSKRSVVREDIFGPIYILESPSHKRGEQLQIATSTVPDNGENGKMVPIISLVFGVVFILLIALFIIICLHRK